MSTPERSGIDADPDETSENEASGKARSSPRQYPCAPVRWPFRTLRIPYTNLVMAAITNACTHGVNCNPSLRQNAPKNRSRGCPVARTGDWRKRRNEPIGNLDKICRFRRLEFRSHAINLD